MKRNKAIARRRSAWIRSARCDCGSGYESRRKYKGSCTEPSRLMLVVVVRKSSLSTSSTGSCSFCSSLRNVVDNLSLQKRLKFRIVRTRHCVGIPCTFSEYMLDSLSFHSFFTHTQLLGNNPTLLILCLQVVLRKRDTFCGNYAY